MKLRARRSAVGCGVRIFDDKKQDEGLERQAGTIFILLLFGVAARTVLVRGVRERGRSNPPSPGSPPVQPIGPGRAPRDPMTLHPTPLTHMHPVSVWHYSAHGTRRASRPRGYEAKLEFV